MKEQLYCCFCGKSNNSVEVLISGPAVFICDECSDICHDIVVEHRNEKKLNEFYEGVRREVFDEFWAGA